MSNEIDPLQKLVRNYKYIRIFFLILLFLVTFLFFVLMNSEVSFFEIDTSNPFFVPFIMVSIVELILAVFVPKIIINSYKKKNLSEYLARYVGGVIRLSLFASIFFYGLVLAVQSKNANQILIFAVISITSILICSPKRSIFHSEKLPPYPLLNTLQDGELNAAVQGTGRRHPQVELLNRYQRWAKVLAFALTLFLALVVGLRLLSFGMGAASFSVLDLLGIMAVLIIGLRVPMLVRCDFYSFSPILIWLVFLGYHLLSIALVLSVFAFILVGALFFLKKKLFPDSSFFKPN